MSVGNEITTEKSHIIEISQFKVQGKTIFKIIQNYKH